MSLKLDRSLASDQRTLAPAQPDNPVQTSAIDPIMRSISDQRAPSWPVRLLMALFTLIIAVLVTYTLRHYLFTLSRLFGKQSHMYLDIPHADWPHITVLVAAHNEEKVIAGSLSALLEVDYPADRMTIIPVNDRSTDGTREIIDHFVNTHPGRIIPFHRTDGKSGKSAALKDAMARVTNDIVIIFDADYLPGRGLIKQLVAPFFDPEVGATMGRVVPINPNTNILTRLLDLERSGGYQVDQQARANLGLTTQYGGTVGGVRRTAVEQVGGWSDDILAEDTDITFRLRCAGWKVIYQNRSECYEEVPEEWQVRIRQLRRWAKGHHQVLLSQYRAVLKSRRLGSLQKLDALMLLGIFCLSPLILLGWVCALVLFYAGHGVWLSSGISLIFFSAFAGLGNFAAFFEIASAVYLDGRRSRVALLPLGLANFMVSIVEISRATVQQSIASVQRKNVHWDKTVRYRDSDNTGNSRSALVPPKTSGPHADVKEAAYQSAPERRQG